MSRQHRTGAPLLAALFMFLLFACRSDKRSQPDAAFTPYIAAFTAGHISSTSPIIVRIAEDQRWRDTSQVDPSTLFSLRPKARGQVTWLDERTLSFQPTERLEQERTYEVEFNLGALIEAPKGLGNFRFQFATFRQGLDVRVTDMRSLSTTDLTWQKLLVSVYTSDDATGQDLTACFTVTQGGRKLPLIWEHEPNGRFHRFAADSILRGDGASVVDITWNGQRIGSSDKGGLEFRVPAITDIMLVSATTDSEGEQVATLLFSDPLDPAQDLTGLVGIAGTEDLRMTIEGNRLLLYPSQRKRLSGAQQGFVSAALRNINGRTLGRELTVDLVFEELKPAVRLVGKGTILPASDGLVMPFEAVNLSAVEVRVVRIHERNVPQFMQVNTLDGRRELARVGRLVTRTTVPLRTADAPDPGRWNRYYLDLAEHFRAEPGAIYRVELAFGRQHSLYPCEGAADQVPVRERTWEQEQATYDQVQDHWYYDDYDHEDYYYYDDDDGQRHDDPCGRTYWSRNRSVSRNLLASDLGLIAKRGNDGSLFLAVSDLLSTAPVSGAKLEVLDLQRGVMASVVTGRDGLATIPPTRHKPFLLVASKGSQRGYLKLDDGSALSVSEFDVKGEAIDRGLKGFLYGERGVWRPGDSLHLTFMLQDQLARLPKDHPVVLELFDPRGRLDQKHVRNSGTNGLYAFRCATHPDAPTGYWQAVVTVGGTAFSRSIRIETVKPNRLKVLLDIDEERLTKVAGREVKLNARWLHGAPARELAARVNVTLSRGTPKFKGLEKYQFNDLRTHVSEEEQVIFDGRLNAAGEAGFTLDLQPGHNPPAVVDANIVTRVFEAGGDASMDRVRVPYYPYTSYAGIMAPEIRGSWGNLVTDTTYRIPVAAVDAAGKALGGHLLKAQVYKLDWNWWWDGGIHGPSNYISSPSVTLRQEIELTTDAKGFATLPFRVERPEWGRFAVRVTDPASGHASALQLYVDWPGWEGRSRREAPGQAAMLRFNGDKERYNVGDEATITIPAPGEGRALVSLETGSRTLDAVWVELKAGDNRHSFPVTADMAPNVYVHVAVLQPHAKTMNDLPIRLYGVIPLLVEDAATRLVPTLALPKEIRTDTPFEVAVSEKEGKPMTYTLAIVDEGLLDLTRFKTPSPWDHFYAREALGVRTWDVYDQVIGAFGRQLQRVLALGGSDEAGRGDAARAIRFKPVVRFVGPFALKRGEKARHQFTINNYVGSVRVMVVAGDGEKAYGNAEQAVPVKKPLMVLATMPRVLAPGEMVDLPVTVFAMDPKVKDVQVRITPNDLLIPQGASTKSIRFDAPGDQVVTFRVLVKDAIGKAMVKVEASSNGEKASEAIELAVRQPLLPATETQEILLKAGERWEQAPQPLGVEGTNSAYLEVSTIPPVDLGRRLQYLIGYPHGCLEQTVSKAFPQLYLPQVVELPARQAQEMRGHVEAAIRRMGAFQRGDGHFNYWPGGDHYDGWTSIYAGHFLVEAQRQGFQVPPNVRNGWLAAQRKQARDWRIVPGDGWTKGQAQMAQAYRLYVLALGGSAEPGAMNRLREQAGLSLQARWMLAGAYAAMGRNDVARELVKDLDTKVPAYSEQAFTYGSDLRDEALIAETLLRIGETARAAGVVRRIADRLSGVGWYSTQSTSFGLMAVARLAEMSALDKGMRFKLTADGRSDERFSQKAIARQDLPVPDGKAKVAVENTGSNLLYLRLVRTGTPKAGQERASSSGIAMAVEYTRADGSPLDPARVEQGTDLIAEVRITHPGTAAVLRNLALTLVFPSGWEIRNARMEGVAGRQGNSGYTYQDIRDDRVMTYFDLPKGRTMVYRVMLNAAYTGRYYLPGAHCEAMYDHTVNARGQGQWVEVSPPGGGATAAR
ncbi:MAG: hypothetical protein KIT10_00810 [Flavobacteriales bacterium]|nr:hypothetical protein [Flavobacteriales bacterium]